MTAGLGCVIDVKTRSVDTRCCASSYMLARNYSYTFGSSAGGAPRYVHDQRGNVELLVRDTTRVSTGNLVDVCFSSIRVEVSL